MATKKKLLQAAAGSAGGAGSLDIPDVFSTYLYSGNSSAQTITNGIDLAGEGGLWWLKVRSQSGGHLLYDSTRATGSEHFPIFSSATNAEYDDFDTTPTSTGFTINSTSSGTVNETGQDYVSWTWRKAPKFFDVQTWTGDGVAGRTISHNLNSEVGMMLVKCTSATGNWWTYHRSLGENKYLLLNSTQAQGNTGFMWNATAPTSTEFTLGDYNEVNGSGKTFVAYLFAHNDGDGEFGPDSDQDIIKCGSYTGTGSDGNFVNLGFEPQWVIVKNTTAGSSDQWWMFDSMRGIAAQPVMSTVLFANLNSAELSGGSVGDNLLETLPTGFNANGSSSAANGSGKTYVYMAIRRGQLAVPEDATDVFDVKTRINADPSYVSSTGVVDMAIDRYYNTASDSLILSRLTGKNNLDTNNNTAESTGGYTYYPFDYNTGWLYSAGAAEANRISWMWKRAPGYFDVVAVTGKTTSGNTQGTMSHNLGAAPEMIWGKCRSAGRDWQVYHKDLGPTKTLFLASSSAAVTDSNFWGTTPTDSVFYAGGEMRNADTNIFYLFASLDGISKVGSASHSGTTNVDCGFTSGARFVLLKRTDASGDWYVWDSERGIVSGNDPYVLLNSTAAEVTNTDYIDPLASGFTITSNFTAGDYIFYAIA